MQIRMLSTWTYNMDAAGTNRRTLPAGMTFDEPPEVAIAAIADGAAERIDALNRQFDEESEIDAALGDGLGPDLPPEPPEPPAPVPTLQPEPARPADPTAVPVPAPADVVEPD